MVLARNIAALIALACLGFAIGDWARHPNALGMVGILLLVVVFGLLLGYLFVPRAKRSRKAARDQLPPPPPPPPPPSPPARPPRTKPSLSSPPAGWDPGDDADSLWSGR